MSAEPKSPLTIFDACRNRRDDIDARLAENVRRIRPLAMELGASPRDDRSWSVQCPHCGATIHIAVTERGASAYTDGLKHCEATLDVSALVQAALEQ